MLAKMQIKKQPILLIYKFCVQNLKELAAFFIMLNSYTSKCELSRLLLCFRTQSLSDIWKVHPARWEEE